MAFWAFRDDIAHDVCLSIASTAHMALRDELGATLLHRAVLRNCPPAEKRQLVAVMLERGASVAARDLEGRTPRDYCDQEGVIGADQIRQLIDDFVLNLAYVGDYDGLEQLVLEGLVQGPVLRAWRIRTAGVGLLPTDGQVKSSLFPVHQPASFKN